MCGLGSGFRCGVGDVWRREWFEWEKSMVEDIWRVFVLVMEGKIIGFALVAFGSFASKNVIIRRT